MSSVLRQVLNLTVTDNCCWERVIGGESYCKTYRVKFSPKSVFGVNGPAFDNGGLTILKNGHQLEKNGIGYTQEIIISS